MKTVMLVEDEEFILEGLRTIIDWEALDMEVIHMAHNGREALELFWKEPCDIVVTDVEMPVLDGLGFLKALREKNTRTRCIILTGYDEFEYARKAIKLDVEDYILKPIDDEKLTEVLAQAARKLDEEDGSRAADMEEKFGWQQFLEGNVGQEEKEKYLELLPPLKDRLEEKLGIFTFLSISEAITSYEDLQDCYKSCVRLQKYRMLDGYGSCVDEAHVENRTSGDVSIDSMNLRKIILKKDKEGAIDYIEDLFINNLRETVDVDVLYQLSLKIALVLQDIKVEYKLAKVKKMQDLTDMLEKIYQAEDIYGLKKIFIGEITDIITYLHTENSHYTPVVRQLMEEVAKNYKEDMNLKTLAYKYHMNASYLGQIFQKEVGCSFNQYLNNTKNGIAKDLILNTNMKINEIATAVGYPDTSYFYRKFKQCFGVSPASLREMRK